MSGNQHVLSVQERNTFKQLFRIADVDKKSFLGKQEGIAFFSKAGIPNEFLTEIWQTADKNDKDYITEEEFYTALKLIACAQHGIKSNDNILSTQVPLPQFRGISLDNEISSITESERERYINLFQSCNLVHGLLYSNEASHFFVQSNLPAHILNSIWQLADTRSSGTLNQTEFIIAMHYISSLANNPTLVLPKTLPSQTYAEATGRFATSIRKITSPTISRNTTTSLGYTSPTIQKLTSPVMQQRAIGPVLQQVTGASSLSFGNIHTSHQVTVSYEEMERYKPYFYQLDTDGSGFIEAEEAVYFFSHSHLPDSELGIIWEIADSKHLGKLDLHDFCVAMHLINMRKNNQSIDAYINNSMTQPSPVMPNQLKPDLLNQRYELENHLVEIKQQTISQQKLTSSFQSQLEQIQKTNADLELQVSKAKTELNKAKELAEDAENVLKAEQRKRDELLGYESATTTHIPSFVSPLPELTRAASTFSGTSISTPQSSFIDPFMNKTTTSKITSMSPLQAKAVSKYGFDITAFDTLSISNNDRQVKSSVNDDLASLFLFNTTQQPTKNNFDDIFTK